MQALKSEIRDGMRIDWDMPIKMDDGLILRADIFRPTHNKKCPVILSYGPYGKGLSFQEGYKTAWDGTKNGKILPTDTYYYIIEPENGRKPLSGYVTIIR